MALARLFPKIALVNIIAVLALFSFRGGVLAQQNEKLEYTIDLSTAGSPLPNVFKPNIDLSGRGFQRDISWPQSTAAAEVLDVWEREVGFNGMYRLQFNLWEINELARDRQVQERLLNNYEAIIKRVSDAGGVVILNVFGTPAGLGKVLDKKSPPWDLRAFKALIKGYIRTFSCEKRYNVWYEVWSTPDLDDFFLGRQQEYLNLYRAVCEVVGELEAETKIHIPVGGPSVSWWFQNLDGNTVITPEHSLIYDLIKFCCRYRLPLDFITWHGYSTDPKIEKETAAYNKTAISLIRDWLSYFKLDRNIPLIVDEWNYDSGLNVISERKELSNICASYVLRRIKSMYEAGLDYQLYFCLEDFANNQEGVERNVGIFWFDPASTTYNGGPKPTYAIFKILGTAGGQLIPDTLKPSDDFVGSLAIKSADATTIILYNYIDPSLAINYLARNLCSLKESERRVILNLVRQDKIDKVLKREIDVSRLRTTNRAKALLKKAQELHERAVKYKDTPREVAVNIKNIKEGYSYRRTTIDSSCGVACSPAAEEKEIPASTTYGEILTLKPYSAEIIVLKKLPPSQPQALQTGEANLDKQHNGGIIYSNATETQAQQERE